MIENSIKSVRTDSAATPISRRRKLLIALGLVVAIVLCYSRAVTFEFTNYDDHRYITKNELVQSGLNGHSIAWAFTTFEVANWHPVTWLSHMLHCDLYARGDGTQWPGGHHITNVILHIANTLLLFAILVRMTGAAWRSALVAALFAVHPLHVESVAWISERKDLLSTFFGFLSIWAYVEYTKTRRWTSYTALVICFALSLMSKPMLVTLPFVLILLDYWPLRRLSTQSVIEKLPLFAMTIASCVITMRAQTQGGSVSTLDEISLTARATNAVVAYGIYLYQTAWPAKLAPFYPLPAHEWPAWMVIASVGVLMALTATAAVLGRKRPAFIVGWLWYLGTLVPVIGLVQVGSQAHADRYTYVPLIGIFVMLAWAIPDSGRWRGWVVSAVALILGILSVVTFEQVQHWRNSVTLSQRALAVTDRNAVAHFNLGVAYSERGDLNASIEQFLAAAAITPNWVDVHYNLGNDYRRSGDLQKATAEYLKALELKPEHLDARNNLGMTFALQKDLPRAMECFRAALEIDPKFAGANLNMGAALEAQEKHNDALIHYQRALEAEPENALAHLYTANVLGRLGHTEEAKFHFARSIQLDPSNPHAYLGMATALVNSGKIEQAIQFCQAAAQLTRKQEQWTLHDEIVSRINRYQEALKNR